MVLGSIFTLFQRSYPLNLLSVVAGLVLLRVFRYYEISKFPIVNGARIFEFSDRRVKRNYVANGRQLLRHALQKYGGKPFNFLTDHGYVTIFGPQYTQELRNIAGLSHVKAIAKFVNAHYPGLEAFHEFSFGEDIIQDVVRVKLTQALGSLTLPLSNESALTLQQAFGENKEWTDITPHSVLLDAVARVSSRLFLGDRLCRDPEWLKITTTYTNNVAAAVFEINAYPAIIRRLLAPYLPRVRILRGQVQEARRVMGRVLDERAILEAKREAPDYVDAIEWFKAIAKGRNYDPVHAQLTLSFVAIHTTADMVAQLMFDLAENPEYIQPLREEVIAVLGTHGWKKTSLYNLKLLDSVMKESQRLRPINDTSLQRLVLKDTRLSDGTSLRRNQIIAVASTNHWDPEIYPDPDRFIGDRFLKMRANQGQENVAQFVSTSANHLGFGHGEHACPGRFFASNEIKIIMCHILLKYDWRLAKGQKPKPIVMGFHLAVDHTTKLEIRRRQEELDVDNLL